MRATSFPHHSLNPTIGLVVTLLALLELARELLIDITQSGAFAPIYVRIAYAESV